MSVQYLATQAEFNPRQISSELIYVFTISGGNDFFQKQQQNLDNLKSELESNNAKAIFATNQQFETSSQDVVFDPEGQLAGLCDKINAGNPGENLVFLRNRGGQLEYVDIKEGPENEYDWIDAVLTCAKNYQNTEDDGEGYWKWGQKVPEAGEYLCKDCGYILELEEGQIFPICEVCLAGEPSGPSTQEEGYWERV